jgi:hypothetical protein
MKKSTSVLNRVKNGYSIISTTSESLLGLRSYRRTGIRLERTIEYLTQIDGSTL